MWNCLLHYHPTMQNTENVTMMEWDECAKLIRNHGVAYADKHIDSSRGIVRISIASLINSNNKEGECYILPQISAPQLR